MFWPCSWVAIRGQSRGAGGIPKPTGGGYAHAGEAVPLDRPSTAIRLTKGGADATPSTRWRSAGGEPAGEGGGVPLFSLVFRSLEKNVFFSTL